MWNRFNWSRSLNQHPPYVHVRFVPTTSFKQEQASRHDLAILGDVNGQGTRGWISRIDFVVARWRIFFDCVLGVGMCALPLLILTGLPEGAGKGGPPPMLYLPCATAGADARPVLIAIGLGIMLLCLPAFRRILKAQTRPRPTLRDRTHEASAAFVDETRSVYAHRRLSAILLACVAVICVFWAVLGHYKSPFGKTLYAWLTSELGLCKEATWKSIVDVINASATAPWSDALIPVATFFIVGCVIAALLSWYAAIDWTRRNTGQIRSDYYLHSITSQTSAHLQRNLLIAQAIGKTDRNPQRYVPYTVLTHFLRMAFVFSSHISRSAPSPSAEKQNERSLLLERKFVRIGYSPILAPFFSIFLSTVTLWAMGKEVSKVQFLPTLLVWTAWSAYYLARLSLGTSIRSNAIIVTNPEFATMYAYFPVATELRNHFERYGAKALDDRLWLFATVLFAAAVGWIGAF